MKRGYHHGNLKEELVRAALVLIGRDAPLRVVRYRELYREGTESA